MNTSRIENNKSNQPDVKEPINQHGFRELLHGLFTQSEQIYMDFSQIPPNLQSYKNMRLFFEQSIQRGENPRLPENRQRFNDQYLEIARLRYLIGKYAEDRSSLLSDTYIGQEGRTYHLGMDIFARDQEPVYAPCNGNILAADQIQGYGYYIIFQPDPRILPQLVLLGHLSKDLPVIGEQVSGGDQIARLGDWNENGGWSRHIHVQLFNNLPEGRVVPPGYATLEDLEQSKALYPDPSILVLS